MRNAMGNLLFCFFGMKKINYKKRKQIFKYNFKDVRKNVAITKIY